MHGGLTERRLVGSAQSFVVSPAAPGACACDPARARDRLSARYLALAARLIDELSTLARDGEGARLSALSVDTEIAFERAGRAAFADDLAAAVTQLCRSTTIPAWPHRLVVATHPAPQPPEEEAPA